MNEKVVGVYTLRAAERQDYQRLTQIEKQTLSIIAMSETGYLRIYGLREKKILECIAQINIQDSIMKVIPVPYSPNIPIQD
jgi:hypothetical protein